MGQMGTEVSVVRSPVRSVVRSPVRGVFGGSDSQTSLQALIALSPSLLIWPAQGAGWQGTSGGTLAASGQPLGLGADLSQLQGKTLSEFVSTASDVVVNGNFATDTVWNKGTDWTISGGVATGTAGVQSDLSQSAILTVGAIFVLEITVATLTAGSLVVFAGSTSNGIVAAGTYTFVVQCAANTNLTIRKTALFAGTISRVSAKVLPGNHLRAGTWASPSDAARGTYTESGGKAWIDPDATSNQYSFLSALSARAIVARVRVPTAYTTDDRFLMTKQIEAPGEYRLIASGTSGGNAVTLLVRDV